jgi:hypothetical protein
MADVPAHYFKTVDKQLRLLVDEGVLVPDGRLQAIADAWKQEFTQCRRYKEGDGMCVQCVEFLGELLTQEDAG